MKTTHITTGYECESVGYIQTEDNINLSDQLVLFLDESKFPEHKPKFKDRDEETAFLEAEIKVEREVCQRFGIFYGGVADAFIAWLVFNGKATKINNIEHFNTDWH